VQADQGHQSLHPDRPRRHHPHRQRRLPMAQVRPEGDPRQPVPESLLPLRIRALLPRQEEGTRFNFTHFRGDRDRSSAASSRRLLSVCR
jgi:hypothetical protein